MSGAIWQGATHLQDCKDDEHALETVTAALGTEALRPREVEAEVSKMAIMHVGHNQLHGSLARRTSLAGCSSSTTEKVLHGG